MKNKRELSLLALVLIVLGLFVLIKKHKQTELHTEHSPRAESSPKIQRTGLAPEEIKKRQDQITQRQTARLTHDSNQSEIKVLELFAEATLYKHNVDSLMKFLNDNKQEPYKATNQNPYTGEMTVIRTKSPWPGTRYFHAQFFGDGSGEQFPQHLSFEVQPGPEAFANSIKMIQEIFPGISAPKIKKKDFMQWELHDGYVVWAKQLGPKDLESNLYNAYTPDDVGTIRIAVEIATHDDEDGAER